VLIGPMRESLTVHLPAGILPEIVIDGNGLLANGKIPKHGARIPRGASFTEGRMKSYAFILASTLPVDAVVNGRLPERLNVQLALGAALLHQLSGLLPGNLLTQAMATQEYQGDSTQDLPSSFNHPRSPLEFSEPASILIFDDCHSTLCPRGW
jgi:hypothetical protein